MGCIAVPIAHYICSLLDCKTLPVVYRSQNWAAGWEAFSGLFCPVFKAKTASSPIDMCATSYEFKSVANLLALVGAALAPARHRQSARHPIAAAGAAAPSQTPRPDRPCARAQCARGRRCGRWGSAPPSRGTTRPRWRTAPAQSAGLPNPPAQCQSSRHCTGCFGVRTARTETRFD